MISIIIINSFSLIGMLYFIYNLLLIKKNAFSNLDTKNWYPHLGINGYKLTYIAREVNTIYILGGLIGFWIYFIVNHKKNENDDLYILVSLLGLFLNKYIMFLIANSVLHDENNINVIRNGNFIIEDSESLIDESDSESKTDIIIREYCIIPNVDNYFKYECCICLEEKNYVCRSKILPCNHDVFCKNCINKLSGNDRCPLCRENIMRITIMIKKN